MERFVGWSLLYAALYFALSYVIHADDSSILRQVVRALIVGFVGTALTLRSNALRKRGIEPYHPGLTLTIGLVMVGAGTWCLLGSSPRATGWDLVAVIVLTGMSVLAMLAGVRGLQRRAAKETGGTT